MFISLFLSQHPKDESDMLVHKKKDCLHAILVMSRPLLNNIDKLLYLEF
jgi:hypothetical protein